MSFSVFRLLPKKMCYFGANCPVMFSLQYIFDLMKMTSHELRHGISNAPEDCVSLVLLRKKEDHTLRFNLVLLLLDFPFICSFTVCSIVTQNTCNVFSSTYIPSSSKTLSDCWRKSLNIYGPIKLSTSRVSNARNYAT